MDRLANVSSWRYSGSCGQCLLVCLFFSGGFLLGGGFVLVVFGGSSFVVVVGCCGLVRWFRGAVLLFL